MILIKGGCESEAYCRTVLSAGRNTTCSSVNNRLHALRTHCGKFQHLDGGERIDERHGALGRLYEIRNQHEPVKTGFGRSKTPHLLHQQHPSTVQLQKDGGSGGDELAIGQDSLFQQLAVHAEGLVGRAALTLPM
ncbi:MAG: hypothetical protein J6S87_07290 [Bacteroidales bacterium]|nr:hypothetical protein [Bacteroidales bacterium]